MDLTKNALFLEAVRRRANL